MWKKKQEAKVRLRDIDFDDATITAFSKNGDVITLELLTSDLKRAEREVRILLQGIRSLRIDDAEADDVMMMLPDAQVFHLSFTDNRLELVAEWNDFENKRSFVKVHDIRFESLSLQVD